MLSDQETDIKMGKNLKKYSKGGKVGGKKTQEK